MSFWRIFFFPLPLGRFTWELSKVYTYIPKPLNANCSMEREGVAEAEMPQKPFKCYIAGFSVLIM